jgi:protein required for attachment to host cells
MVDIAGLYFVIADGERARFVRPGPDNRLHTIHIVDHTNVRKSNDERGPASDAADPFTSLLVERINDDFAVDLFSHLVIVASPPILNELLAMIDDPTFESLIGSLAKDLMGVPDLELWPHLHEWLRTWRQIG